MNTIFIYDESYAEIRFFVLDGDYSHLEGVYINTCEDKERVEELDDIIFDEDGDFKIELYDRFPVDKVKPDTKVIVCGLIS